MTSDLNWQSLCQRVQTLDGAIGTELFKRGCVREASVELYSLDNPQDLRDIHEHYVRAGAQLIYTCTLGANAVNLRKYGAAGRVREVNARLTELARDTVEDRVLLAGSVGPITAYSRDKLSVRELTALYADQMTGIMDGSADLLVIETVRGLTDARVALRTARELGFPAMISFAADSDGRLGDGVAVEEAVTEVIDFEPLAVGCNCSPGVEAMADVVRRLTTVTDLPVFAKPSAGTPIVERERLSYPLDIEAFVDGCQNLRRAGAVMIGGCCGVDPEYIRALAHRLRDK